MSTGKTIVIVAAIGAGVFVLVKMIAPAVAAQKKPAVNTDLRTVAGLLGSLGGLFGGGSGSSAPVTGYTSAPAADNVPAYQPGESFDDYLSGMFGPGIPTYD